MSLNLNIQASYSPQEQAVLDYENSRAIFSAYASKMPVIGSSECREHLMCVSRYVANLDYLKPGSFVAEGVPVSVARELYVNLRDKVSDHLLRGDYIQLERIFNRT